VNSLYYHVLRSAPGIFIQLYVIHVPRLDGYRSVTRRNTHGRSCMQGYWGGTRDVFTLKRLA